MTNVYSSNTFYPKLWTGPDWEKLLVPKDEGIGIMISYSQSREFGFGFDWNDISDADLKKINYFRADKAYLCKYASKIIKNESSLK